MNIRSHVYLQYESNFVKYRIFSRASLVAQTVKHLPAVRETWVQSLGWGDPLGKEMATHSSTLAWKILWTEELNIQKMKIMASGPITSWEIDGETVETVSDFIFGAPKSLQMVTAAMKLKDAYSLEEKLSPT